MESSSILIVEDESIVALNMKRALSSLGYRVLGPASTGEKALSLVEIEGPDLVLLDIKLKGEMDGIQVAERIRSRHRIPVVFVTAYSDDATLARAKLTEPYGYLTKAFVGRELYSTIEMALYRHKVGLKLLESEDFLSTTLNSILDAVVSIDGSGATRLVNESARTLLRLGQEDAVGRPLGELMRLSDAEGKPLDPLDAALHGGVRQCTLRCFDGREIPVECSVARTVQASGPAPGFVVVLRDVSRQIQAEATRAQLAAIVESSEDCILSATLDGVILSWNSGAAKMFGFEESEVKGLRLDALTPEHIPSAMPGIFERLSRGEAIEHFETARRRKDGQIIEISVKASGIKDSTGKVAAVSIIARDITARKNLDKRLFEIRNSEQARIGRDLHDSLGQHLAGVLFRVKALELRLKALGIDCEREGIHELEKLIKAGVLMTRELAEGLMPAALRSLGLKEALRELAAGVGATYGVRTEFRSPTSVSPLAEVVADELYHVAEEALTNAVKHSGASTVETILQEEDGELILTIRDDGAGFERGESPGLGLKIMEYRARSINAQFSIRTAREGGCEVQCRLPIERAAERVKR